MGKILSAEVVEEAIHDLRREAGRVHELRSELHAHVRALRWEGGGRRHFDQIMEAHFWRLNRRETDLEESASLLAGVADSVRTATRELDRQATEVRAAAIASGDERAFLAAHGLAEYPPKGDLAWRTLWRELYPGPQADQRA